MGDTKATARLHTMWTNRAGLSRYELGPFKQLAEAVLDTMAVMSRVMALDKNAPVGRALLFPQYRLMNPGLASTFWHAWLTPKQAGLFTRLMTQKKSYKLDRKGKE